MVIWIEDVTAFTLPGRYVYFSRRLLQLCPAEDAVAFVLAHEMAHHRLGHLRPWLSEIPGAWLAGVRVRAAYRRALVSPEKEADADRWALERCVAAGYDRARCLTLFDALSRASLDLGDVDGVFGHEDPEDLAEARLRELDGEAPEAKDKLAAFLAEAGRWTWQRGRGYASLHDRRAALEHVAREPPPSDPRSVLMEDALARPEGAHTETTRKSASSAPPDDELPAGARAAKDALTTAVSALGEASTTAVRVTAGLEERARAAASSVVSSVGRLGRLVGEASPAARDGSTTLAAQSPRPSRFGEPPLPPRRRRRTTRSRRPSVASASFEAAAAEQLRRVSDALEARFRELEERASKGGLIHARPLADAVASERIFHRSMSILFGPSDGRCAAEPAVGRATQVSHPPGSSGQARERAARGCSSCFLIVLHSLVDSLFRVVMAAPSEELLPATQRALLHRLATGQSESRTPSMVGAVVREGVPVWTHARGTVDGQPPTADTQYRIGSLTKTFVAVLVMRLRDEGRLDLCDPLEKHLTGTAAGRLTIAELLTHTSGLAAETPGPWWERTPGELRPALRDILGEPPMLHPQGRRFHYSNPGFALLGALVGRLRGEPWGEALRREVLLPLRMLRTTLLPEVPHARGWAVHPWADVLLPEPSHDTGVMGPAGQLWSTAADLCRWAAFLSAGADEVLSADSLAEMRTLPAVAPSVGDWDPSYGLGLELSRVDGRLLVGHTGSMPGFLAALWVSVEEGIGGLVLANATSGGIWAVGADLVRIVAEHEPRIPAPWEPLSEVDPALLALTGLWYWGPSAFALRLREGRVLELSPVSGKGRSARFRPQTDGTWTGLDDYYAGEVLRPVRGAGGSVSHLDVGSFVFTREPYDASAAVPGGVDPEGWRAKSRP